MKKSEKKAPDNNFELRDWDILRAHEFEGGDVSFDLMVNGIKIYGMVLRWNEERKENWISFPARKGKDNKYYSHVWFPVSSDLQKGIEDRIEELLG